MLLPLPLSGRQRSTMGMSVGGAASCALPIILLLGPSAHAQGMESRGHVGPRRRRWNRGPSRPEDEPSTSFVAASRRDHVPFSSGARPAGIDVRNREEIKGSRALLPHHPHAPGAAKQPPPCGGRRAMALCVPPCMSSARGCRLGRSGVLHPRASLLAIRRRFARPSAPKWIYRGALVPQRTPCLSVISRPAKARHIRKSKQSKVILRHFGGFGELCSLKMNWWGWGRTGRGWGRGADLGCPPPGTAAPTPPNGPGQTEAVKHQRRSLSCLNTSS